MNGFMLEMKHEIEQLKDGRMNLMLKASNQELIIDRLKSEAVRLKLEGDGVRTEKKRCDDHILKCHQKEVVLTAERDTLKRELELVRESSKRELDQARDLLRESKAEATQLKGLLDCERSKRQKMRTSYRKLNESLNGGQDDTTGVEVKQALEQLREGLME